MKILVSALEHSANIHLKNLLPHLEGVELYGLFDKNIIKREPNCSSKELSIVGFVDVLSKIGSFLKIRETLVDLSFECDLLLLIDSSSFNIPLAKKIRNRNKKIKIAYYILPQAWAWKSWRAKEIEGVVDLLLSIFPFESYLYEDSKKYHFVGHPLLDEIDSAKKDVDRKKIAFMPGSRAGEIKRLFPIFKDVKKEIDRASILVVPKHLKGENLQSIYGDIEDFEISFDTFSSLKESEFAFICSGTATLESALIGTPFVLCYRAKWLDYYIAKLFVKLEYAGLANIINLKRGANVLHSELLQDSVNVENMLQVYKNFNREAFLDSAFEIRKYLKNGSAKNVALILEKLF